MGLLHSRQGPRLNGRNDTPASLEEHHGFPFHLGFVSKIHQVLEVMALAWPGPPHAEQGAPPCVLDCRLGCPGLAVRATPATATATSRGPGRGLLPPAPPFPCPGLAPGPPLAPGVFLRGGPQQVSGGHRETFAGGSRGLVEVLVSVNSNVWELEGQPGAQPEMSSSVFCFLGFLVVFILPHSASLFHGDSMILYLYCLYCN